MDSIFVFSNFTILSILNLVLTYQDYRVAFIYATASTNDIASKIAELSWHHMVPVYHFDLDKAKTFFRNKTGEPTLNVLVVNNSLEIHRITRVKEYLQPNDETIILFDSSNTNLDERKLQFWMKLSIKVLILTKTFLVSVNQLDVHEDVHQIDKISIHPYNRTATQKFVKDYLTDWRDAKGEKMTIFVNHLPPKSLVGPMLRSDNYTFNGPDGVISDLLTKALNISSTYVSDMAIFFPEFKTWKKYPGIASRLHYYGYHKEATTTNLISKFNVR